MNVRRRTQARRGAAAVEGAIVTGALLLMLLVSLEISLAVIRHSALSSAAGRLARRASLRGERFTPQNARWGPNAVNVHGDSSHPAAAAIVPELTTIEPSQVNIAITWPDGDHQTGDSIQVVLTYSHQPATFVAAWLPAMTFACTCRTTVEY